MKNKLIFCLLLFAGMLCQSCKKSGTKNPTAVAVNFIFKFDSTQARLNNIGAPDALPAGHAAQSPRFNLMSAHYLELSPNALTPLGSGDVLYSAPQTTAGGASAIDFNQSKFAGNNQVFLSVPLDSVKAGIYTWLRVSLAYQDYDISMNVINPLLPTQTLTLDATVASFIGFDTYIQSFKVKDSTVTVNANKLQGFWAIEASYSGYGLVRSGQAPAGATTVPNPIASTSPVPAGSCVVTGSFASPLIITGNETSDINITVSLSTNKSFEWIDSDGNGTYDPVPTANNPGGDQVVNMGIRGLIPIKQ